MKNAFYAMILMLLAAGFGAIPAKANTDQHCLTLCINGGGIAAACLTQCTYDEPQSGTKIAPGGTATSTHDVFDAPRPLGDEILLPQHTAKTADRGKDYVCINQCLHNGGQYDRCNKSCIKTDCPTGASGCNDLLGATPSLSTAPSAPPSPAVH